MDDTATAAAVTAAVTRSTNASLKRVPAQLPAYPFTCPPAGPAPGISHTNDDQCLLQQQQNTQNNIIDQILGIY